MVRDSVETDRVQAAEKEKEKKAGKDGIHTS